MPSTAVRSHTRGLVLDAADRLLASTGYQKMSMAGIATEAGISERTIFLCYPSKEEVVLATIDRIVQRLLKLLESLAESELTSGEKLRQMLTNRVMFRFDAVHSYYQNLDELFAAIRPTYLARRQAYFEREARLFADVLERGQIDGDLAWCETLKTAHLLLLATNSLLPSSLSKRELDAREDVQERAVSLAHLLLSGLLAR